MLKKLAATLFIMLYTVVVFSVAFNHKNNTVTCPMESSQLHASCKMESMYAMQCSADGKVSQRMKQDCEKESASLFSKLFSFDLPKLPLEDYLLAAQKALIEKLF
jgi:hypothetical protein